MSSVNDTIVSRQPPPAQQPSGDTCGKCKFSFRNLQGQIECRRFPPQATVQVMGRGVATHTTFPNVMPHFWCGEFSLKLAIAQG